MTGIAGLGTLRCTTPLGVSVATNLDEVPESLVVDFDIFDESIVPEVHERLAEIQATTPLAYCPRHGGYWMATTYDDVYEVIRNDDVYSAVETALTLGARPPQLPPLHYDPPEHTEYRTLLNPVFNPMRMQALEDDMRATARSLLDGFTANGRGEFIREFAHPLTTQTFLSLMGWPSDDLPMLAEWAEGLIAGHAELTESELTASRQEIHEHVVGYFEGMVEQRRADPDADDVTGHLLRARYANERPLTDDELIRILSLLMVAGLHTVRGIMAYGMIYLAGDPESRRRLVDDPSLIPGAVEELLRLGAGTAPARIVLEPVTLHGVELQPGDRVVSFLSAANRDPEQFACPHALQVDREPNRHLTFAVGRHRCLGSNLARGAHHRIRGDPRPHPRLRARPRARAPVPPQPGAGRARAAPQVRRRRHHSVVVDAAVPVRGA